MSTTFPKIMLFSIFLSAVATVSCKTMNKNASAVKFSVISTRTDNTQTLKYLFTGSEFILCHTSKGWEAKTLGAMWGDYISIRPSSIITSLTHRSRGEQIELGFENNQMIKIYPNGKKIPHDLDSDGCLPVQSHQTYTATFNVENRAPYLARFDDLIDREIRLGHMNVASALLEMPRSVDIELIEAMEGISPASSSESILAASNRVKDIVLRSTGNSEIAELARVYVSTLKPKEVRNQIDPWGLPHVINFIYVATEASGDPRFASVADRLSQLQPGEIARLNSAINEFVLHGDESVKLDELTNEFLQIAPWAAEIKEEFLFAVSEPFMNGQFMKFNQTGGSVSLAY